MQDHEHDANGLGPIDAALFDFDGTLVDSESLWLELIGDVLDEAGLSQQVSVEPDFRGLSSAEAKELLKRHGVEVGDLDARYSERLEAVTTAIPEAAGFLAGLASAGVACAVATNGRREDVAGIVERTGLVRHIQELATIEDVERGKPDPALYLHAATKLGAEPSRAVVFEDSAVGAAAGRAAGCFVVGVNEGEGVAIDADLRVRSFAELAFDPVSRTIRVSS